MDMDTEYELKLVFFYSKYLTIYFNYPELLVFEPNTNTKHTGLPSVFTYKPHPLPQLLELILDFEWPGSCLVQKRSKLVSFLFACSEHHVFWNSDRCWKRQ